jgi:hypothetical protein
MVVQLFSFTRTAHVFLIPAVAAGECGSFIQTELSANYRAARQSGQPITGWK